MTDVLAQERAIAAQLRLRAPPPPAVRLSRRAVVVSILIGATALTGIVGGSLLLKPPAAPPPAATPPSAGPGEHLNGLPRDYAAAARAVPKLGPPLPGDLGRAVLDPGTEPATHVTPEGPAVAAAADVTAQARASGLFAAGATAPRAETPRSPGGAAAGAAAAAAGAKVAGGAVAPAPGHVLLAGSSIRAALVTGVRSDLPGPVTAQVTENVYDSATGAVLLAPQGSRLIGTYDDGVRFGQSRVLLTWDRLILPDGRDVALDGAPATDEAGYAGLSDRVDRKWRLLLGASVVSLGLGAGAALADQEADDAVLRALRRGGADVAEQVGAQLVGRSLDVRPSLTIRPGSPVRVLLVKDLVLPPWGAP